MRWSSARASASALCLAFALAACSPDAPASFTAQTQATASTTRTKTTTQPTASTTPGLTQRVKAASGTYGWAIVSVIQDASGRMRIATTLTGTQADQALTLCNAFLQGYRPLPASASITDADENTIATFNAPGSPKACASA